MFKRIILALILGLTFFIDSHAQEPAINLGTRTTAGKVPRNLYVDSMLILPVRLDIASTTPLRAGGFAVGINGIDTAVWMHTGWQWRRLAFQDELNDVIALGIDEVLGNSSIMSRSDSIDATGFDFTILANTLRIGNMASSGSATFSGTVTAPTFSGSLSGTATNSTQWNGAVNSFAADGTNIDRIIGYDFSGTPTVRYYNAGAIKTFLESYGGTWGISISGNAATATTAANSTQWAGYAYTGGITSIDTYLMAFDGTGWGAATAPLVKTFLGLGSNAYTSTAYLPLTGGTLSGLLTLTNNFIVQGAAGNPAYMKIDQTTNNSDKTWRVGHTGAVSGFGSFDIYNETDGITPLSLSSAGAATFSSIVTAAGFRLKTTPGSEGFNVYNDAGVPRWTIRPEGAETGSGNGGYDLVFGARADDGSFINTALLLNRATGNATFGGTVTASGKILLSGNHSFGSTPMTDGQIYYNPTVGVVMAGNGTFYDIVIGNKNGGSVISIPTGSMDIEFGGGATFSSTVTANQLSSGTSMTVANGSAYNFGTLNTRIIGETGASGFLRFDVNGAERARIDASGNLTASSFIKSGGTSSQFLMADGSVTTSSAIANFANTNLTFTDNRTHNTGGYSLTLTDGTYSTKWDSYSWYSKEYIVKDGTSGITGNTIAYVGSGSSDAGSIFVADVSDATTLKMEPDKLTFSKSSGSFTGQLKWDNLATSSKTVQIPNVSGTLAVVLTATATLDFPNTTSQSSADLTITVTGAALGDPVSVGIPVGAIGSNMGYTAFVSSTNTVTVRFHNYSSTSIDPGSGDFKVSVIKQ